MIHTAALGDGTAGHPLRAGVLAMMEDHWRPALGWTVANPEVYPWLWSWDSCFHALVWDALGDERALLELSGVFRAQAPSGFIPHINYAAAPLAFADFWGVPGASTLTQPPMYGHVLAVLAAHGRDVGSLLEPACRAMRHLWDRRLTPCGLLRIFHPWESGIDDHPRWAGWQPDPWSRSGWYDVKGRLVDALVVQDGEAVASAAFDVCPAGFNALAAWNARELASLTGDAALAVAAERLAAALDDCWDDDLSTWVDTGPDGTRGSSVRTLDALLPALVTPRSDRAASALQAVGDADAFATPCGPAGVHPAEPSFDPSGYGRGSSWPHLIYLVWRAAVERGDTSSAARLAGALTEGAGRSGLSEHWDSVDGRGLGARPQGWAGLAVVV